MQKETTNAVKENKPVLDFEKLNHGFDPSQFKRERVGINPIAIPEMGEIYVELKSAKIEIFNSTKQGEIEYLSVVDLTTGETGHMWLSGQLVYQFNDLAKVKPLTNRLFHITHKGQKEMLMINETTKKEEKVKVNQYDIFELFR